MKKILVIIGFIMISNQFLEAKEITICRGHWEGTALKCSGDYISKNGKDTNLVALYRHGWRLIIVTAGISSNGYVSYTSSTSVFYLEK